VFVKAKCFWFVRLGYEVFVSSFFSGGGERRGREVIVKEKGMGW
jgi:hypothetical protein